jgi:hypothetical protein
MYERLIPRLASLRSGEFGTFRIRRNFQKDVSSSVVASVPLENLF